MVVLIVCSPFCSEKIGGLTINVVNDHRWIFSISKGAEIFMFHVLLLCLTSVWPGRTQSVPNFKSISIASNYPRETYCMPSKVATWRLQPCWDMRPQEHCPPNEQSTKHILHAFNKCAIGNGHCLLRAILRSIKDQIIKPLASCVDDHPESNGLVGASGVSWIEWLCLVCCWMISGTGPTLRKQTHWCPDSLQANVGHHFQPIRRLAGTKKTAQGVQTDNLTNIFWPSIRTVWKKKHPAYILWKPLLKFGSCLCVSWWWSEK